LVKANQWTPLADRIWPRVQMTDTCWIWTGPRYRSGGYGRLLLRGKQARAHRVVWELLHGPIPDGLWVLHHCDNPPCVRPDHLYLGTSEDNVRDMVERVRYRPGPGSTPENAARGDRHGTHTRPETVHRGEEAPRAKLTADKVREIRRLHAAGRSALSLGKEFGVAHQSILWVVKRRSWAHVE
jgi:hypothetical protein